MDERLKKAFDFAQESTKQFITLATGIITLTITFSKDFIISVPPGARCFALASWLCFLASVFFGLWTLLALTGTLEPGTVASTPPSIRGKNIAIPSALQILTFFAGLLLTVVFGLKAT